MHIHLGRVAFGVGEGDFVALLHQGANRNRQLVEIVAGAGVNLAIFQGQAATARDQYQDFSFCCHSVLLFEIESVSWEDAIKFLIKEAISSAAVSRAKWPPSTMWTSAFGTSSR